MASDPGQDYAWLLTIAVVGIPAVLALLGTAITREARTPRPIRNLTSLAAALEKLPPTSAAHKALDGVIRDYVNSVGPIITSVRKLNPTNVTLTVLFFLLSVGATFLLSQWIVATAGTDWNWLAWTVTVICSVIFLIFDSAALATIYNPPSDRSGGKVAS